MSASSWVEQPFALTAELPGPLFIVEGARRDTLWAIVDPKGRILGGRIADRGAAEFLAPIVAEGFERLSLKVADICAVTVGLGPGSYTGLRIALSFAKGVAVGLNRPLIGEPSLPAMIGDMQRQPGENYLALVNAFAGQLFAYGEVADGAAWLESEILLPSAIIAAAAARKPLTIVCDGPLPAVALPEAEICDLRERAHDLPLGLARAGVRRVAEKRFDDVFALLPNYAQPSSAELKQSV